MARPTFSQACAQYPHRFTMEHVPQWATTASDNGKFYAPQFRTDAEWYANTIFPGEPAHPDYPRRVKHCYTRGETWPLGQWLDKPFNKGV
jgi:hypothetical protein